MPPTTANETPSDVIARSIAAIAPLDADADARADARQGTLTKPPGSLGRLETLATTIAGITGSDRPRRPLRRGHARWPADHRTAPP